MVASLFVGRDMHQYRRFFSKNRRRSGRLAALTTLFCVCVVVASRGIASREISGFVSTPIGGTRPRAQVRSGTTATSRRNHDRFTARASTATAVEIEDPWQILGVSPDSSSAEIKKAYRKRALKEHPDVNPSRNSMMSWLRVSQAYALLSDPDKLNRWKFERMSSQWASSSSSTGPGRSSKKQSWQGSSAGRSSKSRWYNQDFNPFGTGPVGVATAAVGVAAEVVDSAFIGGLGIVVDACVAADKARQTICAEGVAKAAEVAMQGGIGIMGRSASVAQEVVELAATGGIGIAGRATETALDTMTPEAREMAIMSLDDLLKFLGDGASVSSTPPVKYENSQSFVRRLQSRVEAFLDSSLRMWPSVRPVA